jgi:hypothetical protein
MQITNVRQVHSRLIFKVFQVLYNSFIYFSFCPMQLVSYPSQVACRRESKIAAMDNVSVNVLILAVHDKANNISSTFIDAIPKVGPNQAVTDGKT